MPLLKNESNSPSSPLAPSLFPANLSAPLLSDGSTGGGRDGRGEKNRRRTLHSQAKPLPQKKKSLVSASFLNEWKSFPSLVEKKEGFSSGSETKIKSLWRLEPSTLPCVSFRALERLNQWRRQLEAVGDELQGASLQSLSG